MSDANDSEPEPPFSIERAKQGRAACKRCKEKCPAGQLRMSRVLDNPFGSGKMHHWYHISCLLASFPAQKATSAKLRSVDDIAGWSQLGDLERDELLEQLQSVPEFRAAENQRATKPADAAGSNGQRFEGNLYLWMRLLLPNAEKRIYNLQSRQLIKLFARIVRANAADMLADLELGDVSATIRKYFERSQKRAGSGLPDTDSSLTLAEVDECLRQLTLLSKEDEQVDFFAALCKRCTPDDLQTIIRFIKHDLRINAGAKHVLAALSADAYAAYQSSRDLRAVVQRYAADIAANRLDEVEGRKAKSNGDGIQLMSPISPMLAEACKSVERAIAKCPDGMYSEIKYDGERLQLHKRGSEFRFFSRNLKPVLQHKTKRCEEFIPLAFPGASDLILDSEILMVDTRTGEQLPFGTLGKHKKSAFDTAEVCLFVFDCIYYNGEDLTRKPLKERRKILEQHIRPIPNHVQLSEYHLIRKPRELSVMIAKVLQMGLEGLVLKNVNGPYEPGKRHWLKVKKDYLFDGQMADTADLVVLGASFGTGKMGGMLSVYLMGAWDATRQLWCTVTKVHTGLDERSAERVHKSLTKLTHRSASSGIPPSWLRCKRPLLPDMLAVDPHAMPVWEITGAEFTKSDHHTADGISIRFPRITRERDDKSAAEATTVQDLHRLYEASKECANLGLLLAAAGGGEPDSQEQRLHIETKVQHAQGGSGVAESVKRRSGEVSEVAEDCEGGERKRCKSERNSGAADDGQTGDTLGGSGSKKLEQQQKLTVAVADGVNDDGTASRAKIPAMFSALAKTRGKRQQQQQQQAVDRQIVSGGDGAGDNAAQVAAAENNSSSSSSKGTSSAGQTARSGTTDLFEGVVLFVPDEVSHAGTGAGVGDEAVNQHFSNRRLRDVVREELRYFQVWGGQVRWGSGAGAGGAGAAADCTHALHSGSTMRCPDWRQLRQQFPPQCRHVQVGWLVDAIRCKQRLPESDYPVALVL